MPVRVRFSRRADQELDDILAFVTRQSGKRSADKITARILKRLRLLRDNPRLGPPRESLGLRRRLLSVRPYVIVYQIDYENGAEYAFVLHIVHGARDLEAILQQD